MSNTRDLEELREEVGAIRGGVALSELDRVGVVRVSGEHGFELLDRTLAADLYVRDGQVRHAILLKEDGTIQADVSVLCDDEDFVVFVEGIPASELTQILGGCLMEDEAADVVDLSPSHRVVAINGPFAWELLAELDGPGAIGLRYLTFYRPRPGVICTRGGKTGEYGYEFMVPIAEEAGLRSDLVAAGRRLDLRLASSAALDYCALENWFFNVHAPGIAGVDPIEVQLQWRLSNQGGYRGWGALQERRARPGGRRSVALRSSAVLSVGDTVMLEGRSIGTVAVAASDLGGAGGIALALVERPLAHSGIDSFTVNGAPVLTGSPPFVDNLSLFVNPQVHSYANRDEVPRPGR